MVKYEVGIVSQQSLKIYKVDRDVIIYMKEGITTILREKFERRAGSDYIDKLDLFLLENIRIFILSIQKQPWVKLLIELIVIKKQ